MYVVMEEHVLTPLVAIFVCVLMDIPGIPQKQAVLVSSVTIIVH